MRTLTKPQPAGTENLGSLRKKDTFNPQVTEMQRGYPPVCGKLTNLCAPADSSKLVVSFLKFNETVREERLLAFSKERIFTGSAD